MGYQTFPWSKGDSLSYQKLMALQIPNLKDKSFLDVGCNEGFFCGYADFAGAQRVTGIDINPEFLAVAKSLFPQCNFICQDWKNLGDEKYDVILNLSAIHYAQDQKKLIDLLVSRLKPNGILILEIGVAPGNGNEFVEVTRSIDKRLFPTRSKLDEMLSDYSYKLISRSVPQTGDPIPRSVYHISRRLPFAILAMDDPHAGKTYTINAIFNDKIKRISGDLLYYEVAAGKRGAPKAIEEIIAQNKKDLDCGYVSYLIFKNNLFNEFCAWINEIVGQEDFILDMYIPKVVRPHLSAGLEEAGYFVVNIQLQKALSRPRLKEKAPANSAYNYMRYLHREYVINEEEYLAANPDVAQALAEGKITSALAHYIFHGRNEGRKRSLKDEEESSGIN